MQLLALSWEDMQKWKERKIGQKAIGRAAALGKPSLISDTLVNFLTVVYLPRNHWYFWEHKELADTEHQRPKYKIFQIAMKDPVSKFI